MHINKLLAWRTQVLKIKIFYDGLATNLRSAQSKDCRYSQHQRLYSSWNPAIKRKDQGVKEVTTQPRRGRAENKDCQIN